MKHPDYIGKYVIEEHLGGGMSNVYRARDPILEKTVAIKIMTVDAASDPESRSRFLREARLAAGLANVLSLCQRHHIHAAITFKLQNF